MLRKNIKLLPALTFLFSASALAQGTETGGTSYEGTIFVIVIAVIIVLLAFFLSGHNKSKTEESAMINKLKDILTDAKPIEKEKDILFDHAYDGIQELDNNLPPWWKYLFYVTIVFAVVYLFYYHAGGSGPSSTAEYASEMKNVSIVIPNIDETNVTVLTDAGSLADGKTIFTKNCVTCHKADGGGLVGPNLTDNYWINGGTVNTVFKTIKNGVLDKGMLSWKTQLSAKQMQQVSSYILVKLHGTNPANPKLKMETEKIFFDPTNPDKKETATADTTKKGA